jgi:ubiquinone/menaquinone biosynthesis C-methylase UbiE
MSQQRTPNFPRLRYAAAQGARVAWYTAHYALARRIAAAGRKKKAEEPQAAPKPVDQPAPDPAEIRKAFLDVFAQDRANIEEGLYPAPRDLDPRLLLRALESSRRFLADLPRVDGRRRQKAARDLPEGASQSAAYPAYYTQNFHYQTGGWLTEDSARLYDTQVEVLFTGAADAMRRIALAEIGRALRGKDQRGIALLDAACGSGRFLAQTLDAFPRLQATGLDLSPAYVAEAARAVRPWPQTQIVRGDVTATPFPDAAFDIVSSVYLFHELPPKVRRAAATEIARVTKPGGLFVFADSVQAGEAPAFARMIAHFPEMFHEPYYGSYQKTDLDELFGAAGFTPERSTIAFLTKVIAYRRI